jgi:amino acid adenylation domain-containing protein
MTKQSVHSPSGLLTTVDEPRAESSSPAQKEPATLVELLRRRALSQPDRVAYTFLVDGESSEASLTYAELDERARAIGARLQATGATGERLLLLYPPGLEFIAAFFGCLYAGAVAIPAYPPRLNQKLFRIQTIVEDARAGGVLTTTSILSKSESLFAHTPYLKTLRWLDTEAISNTLAAKWREPLVDADSLAFLQYTSGSTAEPKGVMVSHGNLLSNERMIQTAFGQSEHSVIVGWLPLYHDMGLIGNVLQPLYAGARCVLMSPVAFLQRPLRWLRAISNYKATTSGGPNFAYDLCVRRISDEERAALDLSSWSIAFNGAEPVRAESMERFAGAFASSGFRPEAFYPCYGLAEATLLVSGKRGAQAPTISAVEAQALERNRVVVAKAGDVRARRLVGCGTTFLEQKIVVVQPDSLKLCGPGEVGEILVAGANVARGYWNKTEETERTFCARLPETDEGPFLRTGDLGFLHEGELFVTGRLKDMLVIRGRNHYPQDIELTVERAHPSLRAGCGAAFAVEEDGEEHLVVVQELESRQLPDCDAVIESIRQTLIEEHEIQARAIVLVKAGSVPKTSSGKIQRRASRAAYLAQDFDILAEWRASVNEERETLIYEPSVQLQRAEAVREWLVARLANMLGINPAEIDTEQPISRYGIDSLMAIELVHSIEANLGVILPMTSFLQSSTLAQLASETFDLLVVNSSATHALLDATPEGVAEYPLSTGQQSLWFMHQLAPESSAYNLAFASRIHSALDVDALRRAFQALVDRHPSLRTTFASIQGEPLQQISSAVEVSFRFEDATGLSEAELNERLVGEAQRPFNLEAGPLMRVNLLRRSAAEHVVLLTLHHIIADFWSLAVLIHELGILYGAEREGTPLHLAPLAVPYTGYIRWQTEMLGGAEGERLWTYWRKRLGGELPVLNLAGDKPRPPVQTYRGASHPFMLSAETRRRLKALSREHGATLYMTLLAAFQVLLQRYTGQADILVGSPTAGRNWTELGSLIGYFVNPIVLRADLRDDPTFEEFLERTRRNSLKDFEHQAFPFAELVKRLQPDRDPSRSPLFQVMFALQKAHLLDKEGLSSFALGETGVRIKVGGLDLESMALEQRVAQFELVLLMAEVDDGLLGSLQYNVDLFEHSTVVRMTGHFQTLLEDLLAHPGKRISDLQILTEAERAQLAAWNETRADNPDGSLIHQLCEAQAARTPDAPAVAHAGRTLSYRELNEQANQVAHHLLSLGVGPGALVGVLMERSPEMIVALLGILKAGAAYVPLDPAYPQQRLAFMLEDAAAPVLITQKHLAAPLALRGTKVWSIDDEWRRLSAENPAVAVGAGDRAYVIYTSGSTGRPKGVQVQHGSLLNLVYWHRRAYEVSASDRATQLAGVGFDASVWEIWPYLSAGASLHMVDDETRGMPSKLRDWLVAQGITITFLPTPLAESVLTLEWPADAALRTLLTGGDRLRYFPPPSLPFSLVNHYGPTECTVVASACRVPPARRGTDIPPPIGRPIENTRIYLLDSRLAIVPVGVPGELHIGGKGLSTGYLHRAGLTAERFIAHPFDDEPGARLYRTGDLARRLPTGEIEFLGRLDQQVKVRGFRIELGEIEAALGSHPFVRETVVVTREDGGEEKRLVAYVVAEEEHAPGTSELRAFLKERLPDYMVPSAFVNLDALPLNANGKVERSLLPAPDQTPPGIQEAFMPPRTPIEEALMEIWAEVLGVERVGIQDNFFELGGHSLLATQVVSRVREAFKVELPLRSIFEEPTAAGLACTIEAALKIEPAVEAPLMQPVARDGGGLPLSFAQQRLWFLDQLEPGNPLYNIPAAVHLEGRLNVNALLRSFDEIERRHESLRTHFEVVEGEPVQVVSTRADWRVWEIDLRALPEPAKEEELRCLGREMARDAFDLARGPLLRSCLARLAEEEHVLFLTMHHIISDGWSMGVLVREWAALYEAFSEAKPSPLPELKLQYGDFAAWQREGWQTGNLEAHLAYWKEQLGDELPVLELPTDFPRPSVRTHRGGQRRLSLPAPLTESLKALSRQEGVTLYMTLLAAFQTLLHKYTGQPEIVVGTPIAGRNRAEIESLIGLFVNTLVMRTDLSGNPTFRDLLGRAQEVALGAYAHQDLPFEQLVKELQPERDLGQNPLFQVMLILQNAPMPDLKLTGLRLGLFENDSETAKFDLTLIVEDKGQSLDAVLEYDAELFCAATVERMLAHLQVLLESIVADPAQRIAELPYLTATERSRLLSEWNDTRTDYPRRSSLPHLFETQARRTPDEIAVVDERGSWSYGELNARANRLAHYLKRRGVGPDVLVGICVERSVEMLVGLLGILKAGGAYVPLDASYPGERLAFMIEDSRLQTLVTQSHLVESLPPHRAEVIRLDAVGELISGESANNPVCDVGPENLAYVIYTSGSTGKPKGVQIPHRAVVNFLNAMRRQQEWTPREVLLAVTTLSFDIAGLELYLPLTTGARLVLVSREVAADGARLLNALEESGATVMQATPSTWRLLFDAGWRGGPLKILCGGEALPGDLAEQLVGAGRRVWNLYGPTETTIWSTACELESLREPPSIGRPVDNTQVFVLREDLQLVPAGVPGELHIGGEGLARGYLHRAGLTAEKFIPHPFDDEPGARLYRTGDLARWLPDGRLEYLGRLDQQVKVRGYRIEPGEIEAVLKQHAAVREAVVAAKPDATGGNRLAAYLVFNPDVADADAPAVKSELRALVKSRLPEYMMPSAFVSIEAIPLTPNGKADRRALPAPEQARADAQAGFVAPRTLTEQMLGTVWAEVLNLETVGARDNFFELGGHSLLATRLISKVRELFQVEVPLRQLFETPTVAGLAEQIEAAVRAGKGLQSPPLRRVAREGWSPLSFAQQRLWFLDQLEPGNPTYNLPAALRLTGRLNLSALSRSLSEIVRRHEILRARFDVVDNEPAQFIAPEEEMMPLRVVDVRGLSGAAREREVIRLRGQEAQRPFDLKAGSLFRPLLLWLCEDEYALLLTMHHIVSDGWSISVLVRELTQLYRAYSLGTPPALDELPIQYRDFIAWQREWFQNEALQAELSYWQRHLAGASTVLELPTDRQRPPLQTFRGARASFVLTPELSDALRALSRRNDATLFMTLLAAFKVLLHRYTGQEDILVGAPIAGRNRVELEGLIGFFLNTLTLRTNLSGSPAFDELLRRVREVTLSAYTFQDLPFEKLLEELQPERDLSRTPLFQVFFNMFNFPDTKIEMEGLNIELLPSPEVWSKFDLTLYVEDWEREIKLDMVYNADLFDEGRMRQMLEQFNALLGQACARPEERINDFSLVTPTTQALLPDPTQALRPDWQGAVHTRFAKQAERDGQRLAVTDKDEAWSYGELDARANQLANYLRACGIGNEHVVAIYARRSASLVWALIGILKAGAAFVVLDPAYPASRLIDCLDIAQPRGLLELEGATELPPALEEYLSGLDACCRLSLPARSEAAARGLLEDFSTEPPDVLVGPESLAYVAFTSGSTGRPKGIMGRHGSLTHFQPWLERTFNLSASDRFSLLSGLAHDPLHRDVFTPLQMGAAICIPDPEDIGVPGRLPEWMREAGVTITHLTPAMGQLLTERAPHAAPCRVTTLRYAFLVGDVLTRRDVARLRELAPRITVVNYYGSTETQRAVGYYVVPVPEGEGVEASARPKEILPLGKGIEDVQLLVLSASKQLAGIGEVGEVYVRSPHLARGYMRDETLTRERFLNNPFTAAPGDRMYKTGDLGRYMPDGNVEPLGRADLQVKIRGFRVELGEIEAVLGQHPSVREAVVIAREDVPGDRRLTAYVVGQERQAMPGGELRAYLKERLPDYMLPSAFVLLEALPLTPNGKVDRRALPAPDKTTQEQQSAYVPPRSPLEERLAGIWAEVLRVERVGIHDNFFDLGGHSLLATQLISRLQDAFQVKLPLRSFFVAPTVAELAVAVGQARAARAEANEVARILSELEGLSDEAAWASVGGETSGGGDAVLE